VDLVIEPHLDVRYAGHDCPGVSEISDVFVLMIVIVSVLAVKRAVVVGAVPVRVTKVILVATLGDKQMAITTAAPVPVREAVDYGSGSRIVLRPLYVGVVVVRPTEVSSRAEILQPGEDVLRESVIVGRSRSRRAVIV